MKWRWTAAVWFVVLLVTGLPATAQGKPSEDQEVRHPARQNAILREYFQEQYLEMKRFGPNATPRRQRELPPDAFMERFIDKRIDHFVQELGKRMKSIQEGLESIRQTGIEMKKSPSQEAQQRNLLKKQLGPLANDLGSLHKTLAILLIELKSKADLEEKVGSGPENVGFWKEIEYISSHYAQAAEQIADYFFKPSFTVSIDRLQGGNLLMQLHRAKKMARDLRKHL